MTKPRIKETDQGIQDANTVRYYDQMMRRLSKKGWTALKEIIKSGIDTGHTLEVGPGPGYLGLDWLKCTNNTQLTGIDISKNMIKTAKNNALEFAVDKRVTYVLNDASTMPFEDNIFDNVFTNGSLHEWENPILTLNEIYRVLKTQGHFFISDLRRDMNFLIKWFMKTATKPKSIRSGLITSIQAAYTKPEAEDLVGMTNIKSFTVSNTPMGLTITGQKI